MEAISMRCPNCMGDVIPFDNGAFGRCASCDSVFRLRDGETAGAATADFEDGADDTDDAFDFESFFQNAYDEYVDDESDLSDAYFGDRLDSNRSKIDAAVRRFDIDDDDAEEVYCVVDTTIFGSCKVGFAVTVSGLYMVDEDGDSAFLDWDDFDDCRIERDGGKLIIGGHPFIMSTDEARIVARVMRDLQD
ncbi:hypothetical protein Olsu_0266 [Olsenella uli DSM 7084]|uniref:Uncharacterized protein n=1 Tax=Olsenella uli (strain ATCC 49627 / DSM 7084 / CCUG 31166 / CIP 109912 / JCM 12494 / LMG 11480 / NCIMB 702895 / VPI D76D-27C) TaxID=633147 RepID=E1QYC6_OLSUV|nr:hypothetical protein [Olsenella uli]ADK67390.1 hypothetical protein Olsu_0266 [Olsenella uli DSM 7084]EUB31799.1 hypothetical protein HMPREF1503_1990 [Olsenella uli MSTE5]KRO11962.1 hypothetical protein IV77_GL001775 [Olsenella uli DSM 7084]MBS6418656.1 hypothetical protein [Olsenella uli]